MTNRKGIAPILPIIVIAALLFFVVFDGIAITQGFVGQLLGTSLLCNDDPYNSICYCGEESRKVSVPWNGLPRWHCENIEQLLLDPDSATFEDDSIAFTRAYLTQYCGSICTDLACGDGSYCNAQNEPTYPDSDCISASWGWSSDGRRLVNVECIEVTAWQTLSGGTMVPKSGHTPWKMEFLVESETKTPVIYDVLLSSNYCVDPEVTTKCAAQSYCSKYLQSHPGTDMSWCIEKLPLEIVPNPTAAIVGAIGSGYPASIG